MNDVTNAMPLQALEYYSFNGYLANYLLGKFDGQ